MGLNWLGLNQYAISDIGKNWPICGINAIHIVHRHTYNYALFSYGGNGPDSRGARASFGLWILKVKGPSLNLHILNPEVVLIRTTSAFKIYRFLIGPLMLQLSPLITHFLRLAPRLRFLLETFLSWVK